MADGHETSLTTGNCRVLLRRGGSGPPLLFLHGASGLSGWLPFLARLADRFDVLAPDHPSFGRSETPAWLDDVADLAYYYLDLLGALKLTGVHVVGFSLGGWIALEMAIRSTQRMRTLTLLASAGIRIKGLPAADVFAMDRAQLVRAYYADPAIIERELNAMPSPDEEAQAAANRVAAARLGWQPRFFNPKLRKWLHRIDVPTHIVWGEADRILPPVYASELHGLIRGSKVTLVPGAGHMLTIEKGEGLADVVSGFAGGG
jgi:pimeloyl-ACP methyl ester carboxylesterase